MLSVIIYHFQHILQQCLFLIMGRVADIQKFILDDGRELGFTLKPHAFNIFEQPNENLWTFDLEGRLIGMYVDSINYRRTLDNKFFEKSRQTINGEVFRQVKQIGSRQAELLLNRGRTLLRYHAEKLPESFQHVSEKILIKNLTHLEEDAEKFNEIYLPISILPPDQYMSLVLQISEGCNYNKCTFCNFYRDRPFRIKTRDEISEHINQIKSFFGQGIKLRRSIFLADANALVIPQKKLLPAMKLFNTSFPDIQNIYSFIDVFTGIKKSTASFRDLADAGLKRVYLGVESGNPQLLELLHKPQLTEDIHHLCDSLKVAGIKLGIIFLVGAGGEKFHEAHLRDSLAMVENMYLSSGDMIYISEFYETNSEYNAVMADRKIPRLDRIQIRKMANQFKTEMKKQVETGVSVSVYDIQQFFY